MIGKLNERQCNGTRQSSDHAFHRTNENGFIYRPFPTLFRRHERKRRYRPKDDKINSQNQGQMGPETNMLIQCTLYEGTIRPVLFSLILLFLSDSGLRLGEFKCFTSSLFYHNNAGADSRRGKTVCRSENITGRK